MNSTEMKRNGIAIRCNVRMAMKGNSVEERRTENIMI